MPLLKSVKSASAPVGRAALGPAYVVRGRPSLAKPPVIVAEVEPSFRNSPSSVAAIPSMKVGPLGTVPTAGATIDPRRPSHMPIIKAAEAPLVERVLTFALPGRMATEAAGAGARAAAVTADQIPRSGRDTAFEARAASWWPRPSGRPTPAEPIGRYGDATARPVGDLTGGRVTFAVDPPPRFGYCLAHQDRPRLPFR